MLASAAHPLHLFHFSSSFLEGMIVGIILVLFFVHGKLKG